MSSVYSSVKAVIPHKGRLLVLKEDLGERFAYDFPGGTIEYGETPFEALHREVDEEVGIRVRVKESLGLYWFDMDLAPGMVVCHAFLCIPEGVDVDISNNPAEQEDIVAYDWITPQEFLEEEYEEHESMRSIVQKVQDALD